MTNYDFDEENNVDDIAVDYDQADNAVVDNVVDVGIAGDVDCSSEQVVDDQVDTDLTDCKKRLTGLTLDELKLMTNDQLEVDKEIFLDWPRFSGLDHRTLKELGRLVWGQYMPPQGQCIHLVLRSLPNFLGL